MGPFRRSRFSQKLVMKQENLGRYFQANSLSRFLNIISFVMLSSYKTTKMDRFLSTE